MQEIEQALDLGLGLGLGLNLSQFKRIDRNHEFDLFMSSDIVKGKLRAYRMDQIKKQKLAVKIAA